MAACLIVIASCRVVYLRARPPNYTALTSGEWHSCALITVEVTLSAGAATIMGNSAAVALHR